MKNFSKKIISLIIFLFLLLTLIIFINFQNPDKLKSYVNKYLWPYTPIKIQVILKIFYEHNARSGGTPAAPRENDLVWSLVVPGD